MSSHSIDFKTNTFPSTQVNTSIGTSYTTDAGAFTTSQPIEHPNILMLIADDLGFNDGSFPFVIF